MWTFSSLRYKRDQIRETSYKLTYSWPDIQRTVAAFAAGQYLQLSSGHDVYYQLPPPDFHSVLRLCGNFHARSLVTSAVPVPPQIIGAYQRRNIFPFPEVTEINSCNEIQDF